MEKEVEYLKEALYYYTDDSVAMVLPTTVISKIIMNRQEDLIDELLY